MRTEDLLDMVYLSQLKLRSLSTLSLGARRSSVSGAEAGLGVVTLKRETSREWDEGAIGAQLQTALHKLERHYGIRPVEDPYLVGGHWFRGQTDMVFGQAQWDFRADDEGPVLFLGRHADVDVLLAGSPAHLLDREVLTTTGRTGSTSERLREELRRVVEVQEGGTPSSGRRELRRDDDLQDSLFDTFDCVSAEFGKRLATVRLTYVARAHEVYDDKYQEVLDDSCTQRRIVLGTPLVVSRVQPVLTSDFAPRLVSPAAVPRWRQRWFGSPRIRKLSAALEEACDRPKEVAEKRRHQDSAPPTTAPLDGTAPSLDVELYVRPAALRNYASPNEYYRANREMRVGRPGEPPGQFDFSTRRGCWYDEQGGQWVVSFGMRNDDPRPKPGPGSIGDLVATEMLTSGPAEVLVLERASFGDIAHRLRGYRKVEPVLRWVTTSL